MTHRFYDLTFGPAVQDQQARKGSRTAYARVQNGRGDPSDILSERELAFLDARDSFYLASITQSGWPYVQHRGGEPGFVRAIGDDVIGWAEFTGNRQYISTGNVAANDRVAMIFVDYPNQRRLKILGHMEVHETGDRPDLARALKVESYQGRVERSILVRIEAFDWNCPQHITPRFTLREVEQILTPLHSRIEALEAALRKSEAARSHTHQQQSEK